MMAAATAAAVFTGCSSTGPRNHLVTLSLQYDYKVAVDVVVTTGGSVERHQVFLPWSGSAQVRSGTSVTITSAAPQIDGGLLTCTITEDGHLVASQSQPAGTAVTCGHKV